MLNLADEAFLNKAQGEKRQGEDPTFFLDNRWMDGLIDWLTGPAPFSVHRRGRVFGESTLSISNVRRHFLNVPIFCWVLNPGGSHKGDVWLQEGISSSSPLPLLLP